MSVPPARRLATKRHKNHRGFCDFGAFLWLILICDWQFLRWIKLNDFRSIRCEHHHLFDARGRYSICCRAKCFDGEHHTGFELVRFGKRIKSRDQRPLVKTKAETMAEVQ